MKALIASRLFKQSSFVVAARLAGAVLGVALQVCLARWFGAHDLGVYVITVSTAGILSIVCCLGFPSVTAKFISSYTATGRLDLARGFVRSSRLHLALTSLAALAVLAAVSLGTGTLWGENLVLPVLFGCVAAPLIGLTRLNGALANSLRCYMLCYLPELVLRPALMLAGAAALVYLAPNPAVHHVIAAFVVIAALLAAGQTVLLRSRAHEKLGSGGTEYSHSGWRQAALPMTLVAILTAFITDIDILLLSALLTKEEVAVFSVCLKLSMMVGFGIQAVYQLVLPDLADAHAKGDHDEIRNAVTRANLLNLSATLTVIISVFFLGEWLLSWFGAAFTSGTGTILLLLAAPLITAAAGPNSQLLTLAGQQKKMVLAFGCGLLLLIVLNVLLVPAMGLEGAALSLVMATLFWSVWLAEAVYREFGYHGSFIGIFPPFAAAKRIEA